jgi:mannose/fructose-specific phosphotransferase system component IIA
MSSEILAVLVTHGALGSELVRTAEAILGPQGRVEVVTNQGTSLDGLSDQLRARIAEHPEMPVFLFIDLLGGSCGHACQEILRLHPETLIFSGVNLPMLLEFFHYRGRVSVGELRDRLLAKGRDGIQCVS